MKKIYVLISLLIVFLFCNFAGAATVTNKDVEKFVKDMGKQSQNIINDKKLTDKQKDTEYRAFAEKIVDADWVSRFILGAHWKEITPKQRGEFQSLYKEYLLENYMPKIKDYNKDLVIIKIDKQRDTVYMVTTKTKDMNNRDVNVSFRLIEKNGELFITDIIPEGISFIGSQRTDVDSAIVQNGYDNFIKDLRSKIKNK